MAQNGWWGRVKTGGKKGFDQAWKAADKLGGPVNRLSNKLGSEAFWPTTLDKESDKAARILKSFCKDGFYAEETTQPTDGPKQKQRVLKKIPENVIRNAKGLAIFTTMRTGLWMSGAGGSGILVGRLPDGSWSPPSGILLHTAGLGFLVGVDIYDCVVVINSDKALQAFTKIRCTLGSEISVVAGPVGAGGILETEVHKRQAPIFTYLKSRGFYAGVQIDGTVIIERTDENERFYNERIPVTDILAGKVRHPPFEIKRLMETIKAAQGDTDFDESALPSEPPPGDFTVDDGNLFGVPDREDPDPYGVLALEKEGLSLKEAGTHKRASWEEFSFNPSPTSPVHAFYERSSQDKDRRSESRRGSWRASAFSNEPKTPSSLRASWDQNPPPANQRPRAVTLDMGTQTDLPPGPPSPGRWSTRSGASQTSSLPSGHQSMQNVPENEVLDTSPTRPPPESVAKVNGYSTPPHTPPIHGQDAPAPESDNNRDDEDDAHIEEPVVRSIQSVQPASPQVVSRARLVTVPKRIPPKLPPRNPNRNGPLIIDASPRTPSTEGRPTSLADPQQESAVAGAEPEKHDADEEPKEISHIHPPNEMVDDASGVANTHDDTLKEKLQDVTLDDHDRDHDHHHHHHEHEAELPGPWAKAEADQQRESSESSRMPGGFN